MDYMNYRLRHETETERYSQTSCEFVRRNKYGDYYVPIESVYPTHVYHEQPSVLSQFSESQGQFNLIEIVEKEIRDNANWVNLTEAQLRSMIFEAFDNNMKCFMETHAQQNTWTKFIQFIHDLNYFEKWVKFEVTKSIVQKFSNIGYVPDKKYISYRCSIQQMKINAMYDSLDIWKNKHMKTICCSMLQFAIDNNYYAISVDSMKHLLYKFGVRDFDIDLIALYKNTVRDHYIELSPQQIKYAELLINNPCLNNIITKDILLSNNLYLVKSLRECVWEVSGNSTYTIDNKDGDNILILAFNETKIKAFMNLISR